MVAIRAVASALLLACVVFAEQKAVEIPAGIAKHYGLEDADVLEAIDLTGDGGVLKLVLRRGDGVFPSKGQNINAHYDGKLDNGTPFDSSRKRGQPFSFPLGQGRVIKGWVSGVVLA
jgi:hypothetical protein